MSFLSWLSGMVCTPKELRKGWHPTIRRHSTRLKLEVLEDRNLLSAFMVDHLADDMVGSGLQGSLRYCISNASDGDDIAFGVTGTINLTAALPELSHNISIDGPGASQLTVRRDSGGDYSIFAVASGVTASISGLTLTNGTGFYGGAILNDGGTLTVADSILVGNRAFRGGAINNFGDLTVVGSLLSGNSASNDGGGIANFGPLNIANSTLSGNSGSIGGGIYNFGSARLNISDSTLSGNRATAGGGIGNNSGMVAINRSTLDGNSTDGAGGGIFNGYGGVLSVSDSTLANNSSSLGGGGILNDGGATLAVSNSTIARNTAPAGGGILNGGTMTAHNTIIADNMAAGGPDISGDLGSLGFNLIGNSQGGSGYADSDLLDVDPLLGPLDDNGGPTRTMALLPGSPAIDAGDNTDAPDTDQRGFARIVGGTIDIGAFEVQTGTTDTPAIQLLNTELATLPTPRL